MGIPGDSKNFEQLAQDCYLTSTGVMLEADDAGEAKH